MMSIINEINFNIIYKREGVAPGGLALLLVAILGPSLSRENLGMIFGTIYRTSNCTSNCAKKPSKRRYNSGEFCTISWYDLRYVRFMSDFYYFFLW